MRTRAKQKHVASDRARRPNVPRHILFHPISFSTLPAHAPPALSEHRLNVSGIQRCRAYLKMSEPDHRSTLQDRLLSSQSAPCPDFPVLTCAAAKRADGAYRFSIGARPGRAVLFEASAETIQALIEEKQKAETKADADADTRENQDKAQTGSDIRLCLYGQLI